MSETLALSTGFIPLSEPGLSGNEWKYVKDCLDSGWVSSAGPYVTRFEEMVARYVGSRHAVAVVNGTAALHLSLVASSVRAGEEVLVPTLTFIAPVNVIRYCGAYPVFMDCNPETLGLDVDKVSSFLARECRRGSDGSTYNKQTGRRIKAVVPVHVFGHPVDMEPLIALAGKYQMAIIEDATESLGSEYKKVKTGRFGQFGCFSFNGNKIITTGGGGMVVTDDATLAGRIRHLSTQAKKDPLTYDHDEIGYNYRLTNLQAALGVAQMERLEEFLSIKRENARLYRDLLSDLEEVELFWEKDWAQSNFWFYALKVPPGKKDSLMASLLSENIQVRPIWKLTHTLPMYRTFQAYSLENAPEAYERCISLPCSVGLRWNEIEHVVGTIKRHFQIS